MLSKLRFQPILNFFFSPINPSTRPTSGPSTRLRKNRVFWGGSHLAVGLDGGPEADQVGSGVRERQVSSGATDEGVQDSAFVHVLQVAQVFTQVLLRGVALLRLVLGDIMQGAVRVQADPHHPQREFGRPLVGLQLGGWKN